MAPRLSAFARARVALARAIAPKPQTRSGFAGAMISRLSADWILSGMRSGNQDTLGDLRVLRDRSRDLVRNSPYLRRYHELLRDNIVGAHGVKLQAKNPLLDGSGLHTKANRQIEDLWAEWCRPENCDATRKYSFTELLGLAVASGWGTDGEILIRLREGSQANGWNFSIQLLDPDLLNERLNQAPAQGVPGIYQGVEVDALGAPVAYWLYTKHPGEAAYDRQLVRVPASEIIHDFVPLRPGQMRGVPWSAAVLQQLKMLDGYQEAELVAARIASATMAAIETPDPEKAPGFDVNAGATDTPMEVEPGAMMRLNPGEKLSLWDPQHPTQAFAEFMRISLHAVSAGLGISYGTLTGDLSQANYSSMRVGMLAERDHWRALQQRLVVHVIDRIYRRWLPMAMLAGKLPGLGYDAQRWLSVSWQPRGFDWIDPLKDIQGDIVEVAAGVKTLTEIAAERGRDLEDVLEERKRELEMFAAYGVESVLVGATTPSEAKPVEEPPTDAGASANGTKPARARLLSTTSRTAEAAA